MIPRLLSEIGWGNLLRRSKVIVPEEARQGNAMPFDFTQADVYASTALQDTADIAEPCGDGTRSLVAIPSTPLGGQIHRNGPGSS